MAATVCWKIWRIESEADTVYSHIFMWAVCPKLAEINRHTHAVIVGITVTWLHSRLLYDW